MARSRVVTFGTGVLILRLMGISFTALCNRRGGWHGDHRYGHRTSTEDVAEMIELRENHRGNRNAFMEATSVDRVNREELDRIRVTELQLVDVPPVACLQRWRILPTSSLPNSEQRSAITTSPPRNHVAGSIL